MEPTASPTVEGALPTGSVWPPPRAPPQRARGQIWPDQLTDSTALQIEDWHSQVAWATQTVAEAIRSLRHPAFRGHEPEALLLSAAAARTLSDAAAALARYLSEQAQRAERHGQVPIAVGAAAHPPSTAADAGSSRKRGSDQL